ncbi:MAG: hypothetical protein JOZ69_18455 [Myxococcales bacterium]|nr:hypothetical protein [Myxococcales bacterium]
MGRHISIVHGPSQAWRTLALVVCTCVAMTLGALLVLLARGRDVEADQPPRRPPPALVRPAALPIPAVPQKGQ